MATSLRTNRRPRWRTHQTTLPYQTCSPNLRSQTRRNLPRVRSIISGQHLQHSSREYRVPKGSQKPCSLSTANRPFFSIIYPRISFGLRLGLRTRYGRASPFLCDDFSIIFLVGTFSPSLFLCIPDLSRYKSTDFLLRTH